MIYSGDLENDFVYDDINKLIRESKITYLKSMIYFNSNPNRRVSNSLSKHVSRVNFKKILIYYVF